MGSQQTWGLWRARLAPLRGPDTVCWFCFLLDAKGGGKWELRVEAGRTLTRMIGVELTWRLDLLTLYPLIFKPL